MRCWAQLAFAVLTILALPAWAQVFDGSYITIRTADLGDQWWNASAGRIVMANHDERTASIFYIAKDKESPSPGNEIRTYDTIRLASKSLWLAIDGKAVTVGDRSSNRGEGRFIVEREDKAAGQSIRLGVDPPQPVGRGVFGYAGWRQSHDDGEGTRHGLREC